MKFHIPGHENENVLAKMHKMEWVISKAQKRSQVYG
jgi:hypothetical protein